MSTLTTGGLAPGALRCWWQHVGRHPGRDLFALCDEHAQGHPPREAMVDKQALRVLLSAGTAS